MIAPVCGRFDNAPAHIIIVSTKFNPRAIGAGDKDRPSRGRALAEAQSETDHLEKLNKAKVKADIAEARKAMERLHKAELLRKHEAAARKRNQAERAKRIPMTPEQKKAADSAQQKAKRQAVQAEKLKLLPPGYAMMSKIKAPISRSGVSAIIRRKAIPAIRVGYNWYCDPEELMAYCLSAKARHAEVLRINREKGLATRRAKKEAAK